LKVYISFGRGSETEYETIKEMVRGLGFHTWEWNTSASEHYDRNMLQVLRTELEQADIFIGIYARYYGWVPEKDYFGQNTTDGELSLLHMEYRWAVERKLPILAFFLEGEPDSPVSNTIETEAPRVAKLKGLQDEIKKNHFVYFHRSPEDLRKLAGAALMRMYHHQRFGLGKRGPILFISHSSYDDEFANELSRRLESKGLQTWVDHKHLLAGADWDIALEHALDAADMLIVVVSPESVKSLDVKAEWSYFGETGKKIYPLLYKSSIVPFRLRVLQYIDFTRDPEWAFDRLCEALGGHLIESETTQA